MTFASPELLWLLLAPVALLVWELTHRRRTAATSRPKILRAEAGAHSLKLSSPSSDLSALSSKLSARSSSSSRPRYWLFTGLVLALVALARPQYGRLEEPVFDQSREILVAIDLSRSMLAPDVKPSRLDRAKLLIQSLLEKLEGERVGLVVFAGTAFLQAPLSADYEILREFLPSLGPDYLPQGGSNYGALLDASVQAFSATNSADRFLVILSDGEATDDDWKARIEELKKKNIRVLGLGVGTAGGAMIPDGSGGFAKDERGAVVLSKLEPGTLQELATATGGTYRDASGWLDLAGLIKETVEAGRKGQFLEKNTIRLAERFQWPLALGVWCLLVSFYREFPVRPKPRDIKLTAHAKSPVPTAPRPLTTAVTSLALFSLVLGPWSLGIIPPAPTTKSAAPTAGDSAPPPSEALSKIVGRLATAAAPAARDWAELGRETVTWGSKLQSEQQTIPEGPVRDALAAVDVGSKLDAQTADWPKLRSELEALLKKSEEQQKQDQQKQDDQDKQDQQDKNQDQQNKDQQKKDQKKGDQKQSKDKQDQQSQEKQDEQQKQDQQDSKPDDQQKPGESAFGDMKDKQPPPPPPQPDPGTQKVGGQPERKPEDQQAPDPNLALPLQKLEQLRNQDSPAHLFQLMEGEKKPATKTKGKDW